MKFEVVGGIAIVAVTLAAAAPAAAQADILLRLRSGAPLGDRVRVDSAGGFLALGQLGVGIIPTSGAGYRTMWFPYRAAFRSGEAKSTEWDEANIGYFSWAGGAGARASGSWSFAFGEDVMATANYAVALGRTLNATGNYAFTAGVGNNCTGMACSALGYYSTASGRGSVALGYQTIADADYSVALGYRASVNGHAGAIVLGDASGADSVLASANNEFSVRAAGGIRLRTNATLTTGCDLPAGSGTWGCTSSRLVKDHFAPVSGEDVLSRLRAVPVNTWRYREEPGAVRHMGAFAEDFRAAFGLGVDERSIGMIDMDGVNLAAAKALEERTARQAERIQSLEQQVAQLRAMVQALTAQVAAQPVTP